MTYPKATELRDKLSDQLGPAAPAGKTFRPYAGAPPGGWPGGGSPEAYKPEYCEVVVSLGMQGATRAEMAFAVGLSDQNTLKDWANRHEEFALAYARARLASLVWWTQRGRRGVDQGPKDWSERQWQFMVRNLFPDEYREEKHVAVQGILAGLDLSTLPPGVVARIASGKPALAAMLEAATELAQLPAGDPEPIQDAEIVEDVTE